MEREYETIDSLEQPREDGHVRLTLRNGLIVTPGGVVRGGMIAEDGVIRHIGDDSSVP